MTAVSVIIPVFNAEKHLQKSINSLLNQTLIDCEFIFVNDGSTDNSVAVIEEYQKKDNRILLFSQENKGVSAARNKGIQEAKGDYIGFLDADDHVDVDFYQTLFQTAINGKVDIISSSFFKENNGKREKITAKPLLNTYLDKKYINNEIIPLFIKGSSLNSVWSKLYKSKLIKSINFPVGIQLGEDGIFNLKAFNFANSVFFTDYCGYHYTDVDGSATRNTSQKDYFKRALEVYDFNYQELISIKLEDNNLDLWKSVRLLDSVLSYIYMYLQPNSYMSFFTRIKYVKNMISHTVVQKSIHLYFKQICNGKSKHQKIILNCIKKKSIFCLILMHKYSQFRNK